MTTEEAIYILKNSAFLSTVSEYQEVEEATKMAIEALEKQISKEPIKIKFFIDIEYKELQEERFPEALGCPNCGNPITVPGLSRPKDFLYCEYCGQRLKMEENK